MSYCSIFFSACNSVQNLLLRLDLEREEKQEMFHFSNSCVPRLPIKSVVLDYSDRKNIDDGLATYIDEIFRRNALNLQCFWTPVRYREDYCTMDYNSVNMVTLVR